MNTRYEFQPTCQIPPETLDKIYMDAFGFKKDGVFVEIGAHDGWHWSCTWGLAEIGWRGVYAEPVPDLFKQCVKTNEHRPNVTVRQCCITDLDGSCQLGIGEYGATFESAKDVFMADSMTLDTFLEANHVRPEFDLLVIDVEGMEAEVIAGFTLEKWTPKLVIIERPPEPNKFLEQGYKKIYKDWINTCYLRNDL